jgi:hypothetical protein
MPNKTRFGGNLNSDNNIFSDIVNDRVGIGITVPSVKLDVAGDVRVQSTSKMRFGGTAGTTNFYIRYNSTTNSLDFIAG